jgi:hypothetical protein
MHPLQKIERAIDDAESTLVNLVAKCAPWLAPLPSAWLVYAKSMAILQFPHLVGLVAALVIEALGLASVSTALTLREYNAGKRKSDPRAPFALALALAAVYFASVVSLTIVLELVPKAATFALVIFPFLSLTGATVLALRADHRRRLASIESVKAGRKAKRQAHRQGSVNNVSSQTSKSAISDTHLTVARQGRRQRKQERIDSLAAFLGTNPDAGATEAARAIGVSRQTVYNYATELGYTFGDNGATQ